jgi:tetratricopeptide (TPR) repeat protein
LIGFVGLAPEFMHVVVKGVADLGEPGRNQRSRAFATRAAAEVLLELFRTVLIPTGPMAEDVLASNRSHLVAHDNPGALLAARYALVPFHELGRQLELGELEAWCSGDRPLAARLFVGPEGSGKTRLLMEWTKRLRGRGWAAGFLEGDVTPSEIGTLLGESRPVLVVVDDAASRPGLVGVLAALASGPEGPPKLRVALLERDRADWWESLKKRDRALGDLLGQDEPAFLAPVVGEGSERGAIFRAAADAFGERLGRPVPDDPTLDLMDPQFDRILCLHMAALGDVLELRLPSDQLLGGTLAYEVRAWGSVCKVPGAEAEESHSSAARFAAAVTLLGGMATLEEAEALRERVKGPRHARFVEGFASVYPGVSLERGAIGPVEPELLGEAIVRDVLTRETEPAGYLAKVFLGATDAALQHGFVMLGRAVAHWQQEGKSDEALRDWVRTTLRADLEARALPALWAAITLGADDLIGPVLGEVLEGTNLPTLAPMVEQVVPEHSVSLRKVAAWALGALLEQPLEKEARARVLRELGGRLSELGRQEAALEVAQEAVELYRQLITTDPDKFAPDLARSLHQLGLRLSGVGQWQAAVESAQEGTELYRHLEADQPEAFRPYLAAGLGDLGRLLSGTGQREAALGATEEGADLYRQLNEARPDTYSSCLATSLSDLGLRLSELGQRERALGATEEAVRIRRELAAVWPDMFLPELATSMHNLGKMLTDLGQREAAVKVTEEAIGIRRELARSLPGTYLPALAVSLNNLGANLRRLGQQEAAFAALSEAVTLYEGLAARQPEAFEPKLAIARKNLRNLVEKTGISSAPPPPPSEPPDPPST